MRTIWCFPITSSNQNWCFSTISMKTTQTSFLYYHHRHPHLSNLHPWQQACLKSPSQLDITGKRRPLSMNLKNTSNFLLKISMHVIRFTGSLADKLNSQTFFAWLATSCVYLVSCQSHTGHFFKHISRFCCRRWEDLLRWSRHNLPPAC